MYAYTQINTAYTQINIATKKFIQICSHLLEQLVQRSNGDYPNSPALVPPNCQDLVVHGLPQNVFADGNRQAGHTGTDMVIAEVHVYVVGCEGVSHA
jgi:hypothetical protein